MALLVYMAHIGSFVPCRSAVIGLTDRILTRLPGMESVAQHTSSFMADLAQVWGCVCVSVRTVCVAQVCVAGRLFVGQ